MGFLPENYRTPEGNYMKFKPGDNTFRVLGHAITGWEYWTRENKPIRSKEEFLGTPADIKIEDDGKTSIRHFWFFPVWNYDSEKVQLLEVTQKGIMEAIRALVRNAKWGDPTGYDITVTKEGTGFDTTYNVMPSPHTPLDINISDRYAAMRINMEALYDGGDPFMATEASALTPEQAVEIL